MKGKREEGYIIEFERSLEFGLSAYASPLLHADTFSPYLRFSQSDDVIISDFCEIIPITTTRILHAIIKGFRQLATFIFYYCPRASLKVFE